MTFCADHRRKRAFESGSTPPARTARYSPPAVLRQAEPTKRNPVPTRQASEPVQPSTSTSTPTAIPVPSSPPDPVKVYPAFPEYTGEIEACDLIVCAAQDSHPLKTLKEIDDSPECPAIFCSKGRIVDVEPSNLIDAIISLCKECGAT
jgi:hypothetical protein